MDVRDGERTLTAGWEGCKGEEGGDYCVWEGWVSEGGERSELLKRNVLICTVALNYTSLTYYISI